MYSRPLQLHPSALSPAEYAAWRLALDAFAGESQQDRVGEEGLRKAWDWVRTRVETSMVQGVEQQILSLVSPLPPSSNPLYTVHALLRLLSHAQHTAHLVQEHVFLQTSFPIQLRPPSPSAPPLPERNPFRNAVTSACQAIRAREDPEQLDRDAASSAATGSQPGTLTSSTHIGLSPSSRLTAPDAPDEYSTRKSRSSSGASASSSSWTYELASHASAAKKPPPLPKRQPSSLPQLFTSAPPARSAASPFTGFSQASVQLPSPSSSTSTAVPPLLGRSKSGVSGTPKNGGTAFERAKDGVVRRTVSLRGTRREREGLLSASAPASASASDAEGEENGGEQACCGSAADVDTSDTSAATSGSELDEVEEVKRKRRQEQRALKRKEVEREARREEEGAWWRLGE
ncbi:hypothetical protein JCM10213_007527 [Rhodosporidiobolus nylandii]